MTAMIGINDRFIFKTSARFRGGRGDHLLSTNEGVAAWFHSSCEAYGGKIFNAKNDIELTWLMAISAAPGYPRSSLTIHIQLFAMRGTR